MLETITAVNQAVNSFIWGIPAMVCIIGVGLLLSVRTGFLQIRKFPYAIRTTIGRIFRRKDASDGAMTPFQAVCTALAATVGTGNIAGVAGAIAIGGPGAVFWMWCSALLGMCTKFAEVTLAVHFRERNKNGELVGGPMYYIKNGLGSRWQFLAVLYSLFGVLTVFGTGNATQVNTIVTAIDSALLATGNGLNGILPTLNLIVGVVVAMMVAMVLLGGVKRIGSVTEKLVPIMALFYLIGAVVIVVLHAGNVPAAFGAIFRGAFNLNAAGGGALGYGISQSLTWGFKRGAFSNEAGLGSAVMVNSSANVREPVQQGMWGVFEIFADTIVVCTLTALVILTTGVVDLASGSVLVGVQDNALVGQAFTAAFGSFGPKFIAISLLFFAYSTVLGWSHYGTKAVEYLFGQKGTRIYKVIFVGMVVVGATMKLGLAWDLSDTFNGLMMIPNLIAVLALSGTVVDITKNYFDRKQRGKQIAPMWSVFPEYQQQEEEAEASTAAEELAELDILSNKA